MTTESSAAVPSWSERLLAGWIGFIQRRALIVVLAMLALVLAAGHYAASHLSIDTNTGHMLSADLAWRKAGQQMDQLFPQQSHTLAVVIDGATPEAANQAQAQLIEKLRADPQRFHSAFALDTEPFFRRNGLLYLEPAALRSLADQLIQAQPFLGTLTLDTSLHGLFTLLQRAESQSQDSANSSGDSAAGQPNAIETQLDPAMKLISDGISATTDGQAYRLSWQSLMGVGDPGNQGNRRFIEVDPVLDFSQILPAADAMTALRTMIHDLQLDAAHGTRVRLTGPVALEHEELLSSASGAGIAFSVGIVLVVVLLFVALRSARLVISALITLIYGLVCTAALAALMVGHLNLISIAFGVLYVGLGIDYALYLCMQYRERLMDADGDAARALRNAAADIGGFMAVCAATTSLGFLAFVPTDFTGIAELGLISSAGMFVSLLVSLTLLPALITLLPPNPARIRLRPANTGTLARVLAIPYTHARALWIVAALAGICAALLAPHARFDYDPLHLRDPNSESVATFQDLLRDPSIPTLTLATLAPDEAGAKALSAKFSQLSLVSRAMSAADFVPTQQTEKLAILDDLNFTLGPGLLTAGNAAIKSDAAQDLAALDELRSALREHGKSAAAQALLQQLDRFRAHCDSLSEADRALLLKQLSSALLGNLPAQLDSLRDALQAGPVTLADLPAPLKERWIAPVDGKSAAGQWRVEIWPKEQLNNNAAMQRFVDQVRAAEPNATGGPVEWLESGRAIVHSFSQAFAYSAIAITLLLLVLLRSVADTLLVLIPLSLAGLLTVGGAVLFNLPFNFANVIALPLILGVGVDYGVYIVQRGRAAANSDINLLQTGTARAVLFGALITVANFGNLALSSHPGTRSMGLLLTVGLSMTVLCALVLLPSLLAKRYGTGKT